MASPWGTVASDKLVEAQRAYAGRPWDVSYYREHYRRTGQLAPSVAVYCETPALEYDPRNEVCAARARRGRSGRETARATTKREREKRRRRPFRVATLRALRSSGSGRRARAAVAPLRFLGFSARRSRGCG